MSEVEETLVDDNAAPSEETCDMRIRFYAMTLLLSANEVVDLRKHPFL
jgi:hypothetical protein